jgi:hypothetical protein
MTGWPSLSFDPRLSGDGLLTFFGGLLAFFAILYQVRRADRGLQLQLTAEKQTREDAAKEQRRTIAVALLEEMRFLSSRYLEATEDSLKGFDPDRSDPSSVDLKPPQANPFPIFHANAYRIGEYGSGLVKSLLAFYGLAESFVPLLSNWVQVRTQLYVAASNAQAIPVARSVLRGICELLPALREGMEAANAALTEYLGASGGRSRGPMGGHA